MNALRGRKVEEPRQSHFQLPYSKMLTTLFAYVPIRPLAQKGRKFDKSIKIISMISCRTLVLFVYSVLKDSTGLSPTTTPQSYEKSMKSIIRYSRGKLLPYSYYSACRTPVDVFLPTTAQKKRKIDKINAVDKLSILAKSSLRPPAAPGGLACKI